VVKRHAGRIRSSNRLIRGYGDRLSTPSVLEAMPSGRMMPLLGMSLLKLNRQGELPGEEVAADLDGGHGITLSDHRR
jgi:hypothetical protein